MHRKYLFILMTLSLLATIIGVYEIAIGNFSDQTYLFYPLGIFIWGDAIIFGPFLTLLSLFLYHKNKKIYTGLVLSLYISVRSFIEIFYGLNAQFTTSLRPWELNYLQLAATVGLHSDQVQMLYQITFTCVFIVSSLLFLNFLRKYLLKNSR